MPNQSVVLWSYPRNAALEPWRLFSDPCNWKEHGVATSNRLKTSKSEENSTALTSEDNFSEFDITKVDYNSIGKTYASGAGHTVYKVPPKLSKSTTTLWYVGEKSGYLICGHPKNMIHELHLQCFWPSLKAKKHKSVLLGRCWDHRKSEDPVRAV